MRTDYSNVPAFRAALLHPRYLGAWLIIGFLFVIACLPGFVVNFLSNVIGVHVAAKNKKRHHIARVNLQLCYPEKTDSEIELMIRAHFVEQVRAMLFFSRLWFYPTFILHRMIKVEGLEHVEKFRRKGKNIIILLSHSVGLDVAVASISMRYGANGPYKPLRNPVLDWMVAKFRTRYGGSIFPRDNGMRPILRATREGNPLIYLADEDLGSERCIFVPLFGVQKATIPVLGRLAKSCEAEVFPCICCYDAKLRRYKTIVLPAMEHFHGDDAEDARAMNRAIEQTISICPPQYFWSFRLFQTRPEGEPSVYE